MFAPTRTWRKWHRKINISQKRYALASAVAATGITPLVMARGHQIWNVPEIPLVVANEAVDTLTKTKNALALLTALKADADVERCQKGKQRHTGKARLRNRAKQIKAGPLVITGNKSHAYRAFRNLSGVQTLSVHNLNLLLLAPGGHLGRFVIWTKAAFEQLSVIFGTGDKPSEVKQGWFIPRPLLKNPDVRRVIQSDTIQTLRSGKPKAFKLLKHVNFLKNKKAMLRVNPFFASQGQHEKNMNKARIARKLAAKNVARPKSKRTKVTLSRGRDGKVIKDKKARKTVTEQFAPKNNKYKRIVFA
jgi:large subunit ribosomal protein L4e